MPLFEEFLLAYQDSPTEQPPICMDSGLARMACASDHPATRLDKESRERLKRHVSGPGRSPGAWTLECGSACGPGGGNLTVLASLVGTFAAEFSESILLLEDVGETAYRVDRLVNSCVCGQMTCSRSCNGRLNISEARC